MGNYSENCHPPSYTFQECANRETFPLIGFIALDLLLFFLDQVTACALVSANLPGSHAATF
jgi:hypothetical protein